MPPYLKKSLGQHFLASKEICKKIVSLVDPAPEDQILEIGPGGGALTAPLLAAPHERLLLIEKDRWWANERLNAGGAEVLEMDALNFNWQELCISGVWKLTGNLPYNVASPLIWNIVAQCRCYERAVFMVQKEVGERICAAPDSRMYGALSVWVQCHARARLAFSVPPGAFRPPPKVDSAVVALFPVQMLPEYPQRLKRLLNVCFQQRRKQLGSIFRKAGLAILIDGLERLGINSHARPENLTCADFLQLARLWAQD